MSGKFFSVSFLQMFGQVCPRRFYSAGHLVQFFEETDRDGAPAVFRRSQGVARVFYLGHQDVTVGSTAQVDLPFTPVGSHHSVEVVVRGDSYHEGFYDGLTPQTVILDMVVVL